MSLIRVHSANTEGASVKATDHALFDLNFWIWNWFSWQESKSHPYSNGTPICVVSNEGYPSMPGGDRHRIYDRLVTGNDKHADVFVSYGVACVDEDVARVAEGWHRDGTHPGGRGGLVNPRRQGETVGRVDCLLECVRPSSIIIRLKHGDDVVDFIISTSGSTWAGFQPLQQQSGKKQERADTRLYRRPSDGRRTGSHFTGSRFTADYTSIVASHNSGWSATVSTPVEVNKMN